MAIQVAGALLDGCVLAMIAQGDAYGYSLTQNIKKTLGVSESTLYPVVRRLQTEGSLTTYDQPHNGRNRRYYRITDLGVEKYQTILTEWQNFKNSIDKLLGVKEMKGDNDG